MATGTPPVREFPISHKNCRLVRRLMVDGTVPVRPGLVYISRATNVVRLPMLVGRVPVKLYVSNMIDLNTRNRT